MGANASPPPAYRKGPLTKSELMKKMPKMNCFLRICHCIHLFHSVEKIHEVEKANKCSFLLLITCKSLNDMFVLLIYLPRSIDSRNTIMRKSHGHLSAFLVGSTTPKH